MARTYVVGKVSRYSTPTGEFVRVKGTVLEFLTKAAAVNYAAGLNAKLTARSLRWSVWTTSVCFTCRKRFAPDFRILCPGCRG